MAKRRGSKSKSKRSSAKGSDASPWLVGGLAVAVGVGVFFLVRPRSAAAAEPRPQPMPTSLPTGSGRSGLNGGGSGSSAARNPATTDLQERLNAWGAGLTADGVYGPRTDAALDAHGGQIGLSPEQIAALHASHTEADVAAIMSNHQVYTLPPING